MAQGTTKGVPIDTDPLLAADSDLLVASQKATKAYADTKQTALGFTPENVANKQNSLATDGTGAKYATVDAINSALNLIPFDPSKAVYIEDFLGYFSNTTANTQNPNTAWFNLGGTPRMDTVAPAGSFSDAVGVVQMWTQNSASSSGWVGAIDMNVRCGFGSVIFESRIRINSLSTAINRIDIYSGLASRTSYLPGNRLVFRYSDNINSGKFQLDNGLSTVDSGVVVAVDTWYKLRIETNSAGTLAKFFIDGVQVGTLGTLPTGAMSPLVAFRKTVGTTNILTYVDYIYTLNTLNVSR